MAGINLAAFGAMPNAQLDQFIHALMWKAVPVIILCGGGAMLLRELLQMVFKKRPFKLVVLAVCLERVRTRLRIMVRRSSKTCLIAHRVIDRW